jgi:uncharacterized Ntn-hydrolase superfamily protein
LLLKKERVVFLFVWVFIFLHLSAFATWSIIIVDPKTKQIGIAGASCTPSVYGIGAIYPGKGAIVVQANGNPFARLQGFRMLMNGFTPAAILDSLKKPEFDPENQQYAIISMADPSHPVTYTGLQTVTYSGHLTGNGISVQGNMLTHPDELQAIYDAAIKAQKDSLPLQDILMIALEAGAKAGGDKRCGDRKAASAFVIVAKPGDIDKYWLNLAIYGDDGHTHAVEALRKKFDDWKGKRED